VAIVFFFFALLMGVATQHFLSRFMPNLPYTAVILVEGIALAAFHNGVNKNLGTLSDSIDMWVHIDAHLLLYVFLPALLFGDAYKMNPHHVKTCFWPCFILAGPGVFIGTLLTTLVAKFILPYDWDWNLVGSIHILVSSILY
jgi:NhaP-type Na+/H+ or K+/H+ antiporter